MLLGLDVGTTGCKAAVFTPHGEIRGYGFEEYGIISTEDRMAEQDPEKVWEAVCRVLKAAFFRSGSKKIDALSVSVQGDAIIPVDCNFRPLYNAVLGMDYRSHEQATKCEELFGGKAVFEMTGMRPHPINALCKILWMREKHPQIYKKAWKITTYADYILGKLGADPVIDYTMASRTMAFDIKNLNWSNYILERLDVSPELFSKPLPSGITAGKISKQAVSETGLPEKIALVTGGHDQACAALGAGVVKEGTGVVSTGTAEVLSTAFEKPHLNETMYRSYYPCYIFAKQNMYFTFTLNHIGGLLLRWFRDNFAFEEVEEAKKKGTDPYSEMIEKVPEGPVNLMVLPHFNGSGTPFCDMSSRGAIVGMTLATNRHHLVRAILESQTYELRINLETLNGAGISVQELNAVGGGAKSSRWLQIKADIMQNPVHTLKVKEAACLGAAILAGTACGIYSSIDQGVETTVFRDKTYYPDRERSERYNHNYSIYKEIYPSLAPINRRLSQERDLS